MKRLSLSRNFPVRKRLQRALSSRAHKQGKDHFRPEDFKIEALIVEMQNLDPVFEGYRIVHLTDLHVGQWLSTERFAGVVYLVNQQNPDLILMTGDYVSYEMGSIVEDMLVPLGALRAGDGKIAVLGNHDYWTDVEQMIHLLHGGGFTVLLNDVFKVRRGKAILQIAGVDTAMLQRDRLDVVLKMLSPGEPAILLIHEPDFADISAESGRFFLQLSGHSHGGQIVLPIVGSLLRGPYFWKYPLGLYRIGGLSNSQALNTCQPPSASRAMLLYTNRGLGTNILWLRINCPPEILLVTLKSIRVAEIGDK